MKIGYARVSTKDQSLDAQIDMLKKEGCERIFAEKASGKKGSKREEFEKCLNMLRAGDILIVVALDRLGRSTSVLVHLLEDFHDMGIHFKSINDGMDTSTPHGRFIFTVIAALAEVERTMTRERTKDGLAAARARGRVGGRPPTDPNKIKFALHLYEEEKNRMTVKEICNTAGISVSKLYKELQKRKHIE